MVDDRPPPRRARGGRNGEARRRTDRLLPVPRPPASPRISGEPPPHYSPRRLTPVRRADCGLPDEESGKTRHGAGPSPCRVGPCSRERCVMANPSDPAGDSDRDLRARRPRRGSGAMTLSDVAKLAGVLPDHRLPRAEQAGTGVRRTPASGCARGGRAHRLRAQPACRRAGLQPQPAGHRAGPLGGRPRYFCRPSSRLPRRWRRRAIS